MLSYLRWRAAATSAAGGRTSGLETSLAGGRLWAVPVAARRAAPAQASTKRCHECMPRILRHSAVRREWELAPPLGGDEGADVGQGARIEDVAGFDPPAAGGPDTEPHLAIEKHRLVAVAVDRDRHAGSDGRARARAVHVEMARGAVDLEGGAGLGRSGVDRLEIEVVSGAAADEAIGWMRDHVDERMPDRRQAPSREPGAVVAGPVVQ